MKESEIEQGTMYTDGKTARTAVAIFVRHGTRRVEFASSKDNFYETDQCKLSSFAAWAVCECVVSVEMGE